MGRSQHDFVVKVVKDDRAGAMKDTLSLRENSAGISDIFNKES